MGLKESLGAAVYLNGAEVTHHIRGFADTIVAQPGQDDEYASFAFSDCTVKFPMGELEIFSAVRQNLSQVVRKAIFDKYPDANDYSITDILLPQDGKEFRNRVKAIQKHIQDQRLMNLNINTVFRVLETQDMMDMKGYID